MSGTRGTHLGSRIVKPLPTLNPYGAAPMTADVHALLTERPNRLRLFNYNDLTHRVSAPWQIKGVLREQSVTLLYGKRGCYKSFVALDLAASLATGTPWHGHVVREKGLVIYVAAEGGGGMVQRARAWSEQRDIPGYSINMKFITEPIQVTATSDDVDILTHRIHDAIGFEPAGYVNPDNGYQCDHDSAREWPVLIVIDTLARCFVGDENKQQDMGQFIQGVDRLKVEFGCSIMVLHHTGIKQDRERGSTVLGGACDTIYKLEADKGKSTLSFINEKMKDGAEPAPIPLSFREVDVKRYPHDAPDEALSSIIIETPTVRPLKPKQALVLREIEMLDGPIRWKALVIALSGKVSARTITVALKDLVEMGLIIEQSDGFVKVVEAVANGKTDLNSLILKQVNT